MQNYPLYILTTSPQPELKFHYIVHTCLDVIEEKASSLAKAATDPREHYLGLLYPTEDYKVYGYVANTKVKFVIVIEAANLVLRDSDIRGMFRKLHTGYTDMMSNPFYTPGEQIKSKMFHKLVTSLMQKDQ